MEIDGVEVMSFLATHHCDRIRPSTIFKYSHLCNSDVSKYAERDVFFKPLERRWVDVLV